MSVEPEAFRWLSAQAYAQWGRMPKADRGRDEIRAWGETALRLWRDARADGHELSDAQLRATAASVATYMVKTHRQRRSRPAPRTTAESRAMERVVIGVVAELMDESREDGRTSSAREVARRVGTSKTKAGRILAKTRGAPKRDALASKLRPTEQAILGLAERLLPSEGECVVRLGDVAARLWPNAAGAEPKPGTVRQHRKRIIDGLASLAPLSFYAASNGGDLLALRRGRRWTEADATARLARAAADPRSVAGLPAERVGGGFWASPEVRALVAALRVAIGRTVPMEVFWDFLRLQGHVLDARPVARVYAIAQNLNRSSAGDFPDFARYVLSDRPTRPWRFEPAARRALSAVASCVEHLYEGTGRWGGHAEAAVHSALHDSGLYERVDLAGQGRIDAFRAIVDMTDDRGDPLDCYGALDLCERLAHEEQAGAWSATPWIEHGAPF